MRSIKSIPLACLWALLTLLLTVSAPAQAEIYASDFVGANYVRPEHWNALNASQSAHWVRRDGYLVTGQAATLPVQGPSYAYLDASMLSGATNYEVTVDFWMEKEAGKLMLLGRWKDESTHYAAELEANAAGRRSVRINRVFRGTTTTLASRDTGLPAFERNPPPNPPIRFAMSIEDGKITVRLNGQEVVSATDDRPVLGETVGLGQLDNSVFFTRFSVRSVATNALAAAVAGRPAPAAGDNGPTRVRIGVYFNSAEAVSVLARLKDELGYWNAQTKTDGQSTELFIETNTLEQAEELAVGLREQGFSQAQSIGVASGDATPYDMSPGSLPALLFNTPTYQNLTPEERSTLASLPTGTNASAQDLLRLQQRPDLSPAFQEKLERMAQEIETLRTESESAAQQRADAAKRIKEMRDEAQQRLRLGDLRGAEKILGDMKTADPDSTWIAVIESGIQDRRDKLAELDRQRELLQGILKNARDAEVDGEIELARNHWLQVQSFPHKELLDAAIESEAAESVRRLNGAISQKSNKVASDVDWVTKALYGVGGVVGLIGLAFLAYVLTTKRRVKRIMEEQLPSMILPELMEGLGPLGIEARPQQLALGAPEAGDIPSDQQTTQMMPMFGDSSRSSSGVRGPAPRPERQAAGAPRPSISTRRGTLTPPAPERPATAAPAAPERSRRPEASTSASPQAASAKATPSQTAPPPVRSAGAAGGIDLSNLELDSKPSHERLGSKPAFSGEEDSRETLNSLLQGLPGEESHPTFAPQDETVPGSLKLADSQAPPIGSEDETLQEIPKLPKKGHTDFGEFGLGESFEFTPPPVRPKSSQGAEPAEQGEIASVGEVYSQNFSDVPLNSTPNGWEGSFDFANLTVVDSSGVKGAVSANRALAYQKKTGSGQVYYSCTFPDTSGVVEIEFDVCCADKNRYLLGVYIEKNKDFRHSIQTVVHRSNPQAQASLRLQGKPTPYAMGEWAHVHYILDLQKKFLSGTVNGEAVLNGELMDNMPDVVNTLAIRDNHPTTGTLYLSNITITRKS